MHANGINNTGTIVGFSDSGGFIESGGIFTATTVSLPYYVGSVLNDYPMGINAGGTLVGTFLEQPEGQIALISHGYVDNNGSVTVLDDPSADLTLGGTTPTAINATGTVAGYYATTSGSVGFIESDGTFTTIIDPNAVVSTEISAINATGTIAGTYIGTAYENGFIESNGTYTTIDDPNAVYGTYINGINDEGQIVGYYVDGNEVADGFIYSGGTFTTVNGPGSANHTDLIAINDSGTIVGNAFGVGTAPDFAYTFTLCFVEGTRILTPEGYEPIEDLKFGDLVVTKTGAKPIKWIGERTYDGRMIADNHLSLPICIKAHALGGSVPSRDLHVSPGHGIYVDGVLAPAWRLVNGISITQAKSVDTVRYLNIEMDTHEVILAEGCPVETFLEIEGKFRNQFQNAAQYSALYPDEAPRSIEALPRVEEGIKLHRIWTSLMTRAQLGVPPAAESPGDAMRGFVDQTGETVSGWAQLIENPECPVELNIFVGSVLIGSVLANAYRPDLRAAKLGSGCHGFSFKLTEGGVGNIVVRRAIDGAGLPKTEAALARVA